MTEQKKWEIYKNLVVYVLLSVNYIGDAEETADSLDMSFDEIKDKPMIEWFPAIMVDLADYAKDCPERFPG